MVSLYLWMLLLLLRQNWVSGNSACTKTIQVSGVRGKDVTLEVSDGKFIQINWILLPEGTPLALIFHGRDPITDLISPLRGRLAAINGSLIIKRLQPGDQRRYTAKINTESDVTSVCYDLGVYEELSERDIIITPNITSLKPCEVVLTGSVQGKNVTSITWNSTNSSYHNVTGNRLLVSSNDTYSIFIFIASNPVSNASKSVQPQQYCDNVSKTEQEGERARLESNGSTWRTLVIIAAVAVIIAMLLFICFRIRKQKKESRLLTEEQGGGVISNQDNGLVSEVTNTAIDSCYAKVNYSQGGGVISNQDNGLVKEHVSEDTKTAIESCYDKVNYSRVKEPVSEDTKTAIESCYDKVNYSRIHGPEAVAAPAEPSYQTINRAQSETPQQNGGVKTAENPASLYSQIQYTKGKNVPNPTQPTKEEYYDDNKTIYEKVK